MREPAGGRLPLRFNFTRKSIDALPSPENGWAYHYDTGVRGLAIGVSPNGRKTFVLYRKVQGRPERMRIGLYPDLSIERARGDASRLNGQIARGENPAQAKREVRAQMSFSELFRRFVEDKKEQSRKTWPEDEQQFRRYLEPWSFRKLSGIRREDVIALHKRIGRDHGHYAANRLLALLHAMFSRAAKQWGWTGANPAHGIEKFRERSRDRFLHADELPRFFRALREEANQSVRDYILMSLLTGARRGNVLAMRFDQLNLARGTWTIPDTKNGEPLTVTLSAPAIELLRRRREENDGPWVFPGRGKTGHLVEPKATWQRIRQKAGITDVHLHDLRRTLGSWEANTGASLSIIGRSLGHKNISTTAIYARLSLDPVRQAVDRATNAMLEAAGMAQAAASSDKAETRLLAALGASND